MNSDVSRAEAHLNSMADAKKMDDYVVAWQDFLVRLEMIWEKSRQRYQGEKWWQKLYAPYGAIRRKDPLIRFLKQARNAETHSIDGSLDAPVRIYIEEELGRSFSPTSLGYKMVNGCLTISMDTDNPLLKFKARTSRDVPYLKRFKNRGAWYNPPSSYLGNEINTIDPIVVGKLGLEFAKSFIGAVEREMSGAL